MPKEWYKMKSYYYDDDERVEYCYAGKKQSPIKPTRDCYREKDRTVYVDWFDSLEAMEKFKGSLESTR